MKQPSLKLYMSLLVAVLVQVVSVYGQDNGIHPTVTVANGKLVGKWQSSRAGSPFASYEGIPFAQPPVRFEPPKPAANWTEAIDATFLRSACPQGSNGNYYGSEDCLFINVYVPKSVNESKTPVETMVWIHGGGFQSGSGGMYGANYFMDHQVVLVTFNYRLGILGFLNSGNNSLVQGNMGLKDQILALKWVQQNIRSFNGDAGKVTIFGESAGGALVHHLMISPAAKGLFQKVIAQSGSAISPWAFTPTPKKNADDLAFQVGCGFGLDSNALNCLRQKSVRDILDAQSRMALAITCLWVPTMDTNASDYSVLPASPKALISDKYADHNSINVPIMAGVVQEDGYLFAKPILDSDPLMGLINLFWNFWAPKLFQYDQYFTNQTAKDKISAAIRKFYFNNQPLSKKVAQNFSDATNDVGFYMGMKETTLLHARGNPSVYTYNFRYQGNFTLAVPVETNTGPTHADELQYLFSRNAEPYYFPELKPNSPDENFSLEMVKLWVDFAKNSLDNLRLGGGSSWKPLDKGAKASSFQWYNINTTSTMGQESPEILKRWEFLNKIFKGTPLEITA